MDTLAFGYILPTTGRIRDFNPLETCAARRTRKKGRMPPGMPPVVRFIVIFCLQHWVYFILFAGEMQGKIISCASLLLLLVSSQQDILLIPF